MIHPRKAQRTSATLCGEARILKALVFKPVSSAFSLSQKLDEVYVMVVDLSRHAFNKRQFNIASFHFLATH